MELKFLYIMPFARVHCLSDIVISVWLYNLPSANRKSSLAVRGYSSGVLRVYSVWYYQLLRKQW